MLCTLKRGFIVFLFFFFNEKGSSNKGKNVSLRILSWRCACACASGGKRGVGGAGNVASGPGEGLPPVTVTGGGSVLQRCRDALFPALRLPSSPCRRAFQMGSKEAEK